MSDVFSGVDLSAYADDAQQGDGYTRVQWVNGDPKTFGAAAKQRKIDGVPGHLFIAADRLPDGFVPLEPWIEWTESFRSGDVPGYRADRVGVIIIAARQQPYAQQGDTKHWLDRWDRNVPGIRMHADIMMIVDGLEPLGPVVLSTNSTLVSLAFTASARGGKAGIISTIQSELVDPANRVAKRVRLHTAAFRVEIGGELDGKGQPVFSATQGAPVTRPTLYLPAALTDADKVKRAAQLFVGLEPLQNDIIPALDASLEWRKHRYGNDVPEAEIVQAQTPRNAPQPVEDIPW
jgi:hypothetical protein